MEARGFSLLELFAMGGPIMWPLLLFSITVVGIIIERSIFFLYHNLGVRDLQESCAAFIRARDFEGALSYFEPLSRRRLGARVLSCLIERRNLPEQKRERALEAEALGCIQSLENGFSILTALASISPLTGFLGTVTGMIGAFRSIAEAAEVNAQIVAGGIYEALITTVFGLCIAIGAMGAHSIFSHLCDRFAAETEGAASELLLLLDDFAVGAEASAGAQEKEISL
ncbi:MAG: MotA/TolQ/ExbB proton channel family protein [Treponema sp.]|nr:MotA/TolQ/ExbB proton channel family protein [Treponema sp.]